MTERIDVPDTPEPPRPPPTPEHSRSEAKVERLRETVPRTPEQGAVDQVAETGVGAPNRLGVDDVPPPPPLPPAMYEASRSEGKAVSKSSEWTSDQPTATTSATENSPEQNTRDENHAARVKQDEVEKSRENARAQRFDARANAEMGNAFRRDDAVDSFVSLDSPAASFQSLKGEQGASKGVKQTGTADRPPSQNEPPLIDDMREGGMEPAFTARQLYRTRPEDRPVSDDPIVLHDNLPAKVHLDSSGEIRRVDTLSGVSNPSARTTGEFYRAAGVDQEGSFFRDGWNPHLKDQNLQPNCEYNVDESPQGSGRPYATYQTDSESRVVRVCVDDLRLTGPSNMSLDRANDSEDPAKGGTITDADQRRNKREQRVSGDYDGGHLIGQQFWGAGEGINRVAMPASMNRSGVKDNWYALENVLAGHIEAGRQVGLDVEVLYADGDSGRIPADIKVSYSVDGVQYSWGRSFASFYEEAKSL